MSEIFAVSIISECGFSVNEYRMHCRANSFENEIAVHTSYHPTSNSDFSSSINSYCTQFPTQDITNLFIAGI